MARGGRRADRAARPGIGVIGSLCSSDLVLAELLRSAGLRAEVFRPAAECDLGDHSIVLFPNVAPESIRYFVTPLELLRLLRTVDVVFSFTAALGFALERLVYLYPLLERAGWPPYVNVSTGADITERARESSSIGKLQRATMRNAFIQSVPPYPEAIRTAAAMRLRNACSLPPVQVAIDAGFVATTSNADRWRRTPNELLLFSASRLDWGEADRGPRSSTKGNDRFFRALARFVGETNRPVQAVVLERGSDRENARRLVNDLGLEGVVTWAGETLTREELFAAMWSADLIVDQFDIGALGMIAWEAFNVGRPVLTYVDPESERLVYDENAPILNAHTVEDIVKRLHEASDPARLAEITDAATRWAANRQTRDMLPRYLFYATLATGRAAADFGWNRPHGYPTGFHDS